MRLRLSLIFLIAAFIYTPLAFSQNTNFRLLGSCYYGGNGSGSLFTINPDGSGFSKLKSFDGTNGRLPGGKIIKATNGNFYGVTSAGGSFGLGVVYNLNANGTGYFPIFNFDGVNGMNPVGGLLQGPDGYLYGATSGGGSGKSGVIFKINVDGTGFQKLIEFDGVNKGSVPTGVPLIASNSILYGMTTGGGQNGAGVIYSVNTNGSNFSKLRDFPSSAVPVPVGGLIQAADGNLYGLTYFGGTTDEGQLFRMSTNGSGYTGILNFTGNNQVHPIGGLFQASDGFLYGVFESGRIFKSTIAGANFSIVAFSGIDDYGTLPALYETSTSEIIGINTVGGANNKGYLFKLSSGGSGYTSIFDFDTDKGFYQSMQDLSSTVTEMLPGTLLGSVNMGGASNNGVIFKLTLGGTYTKLTEFPVEAQFPRSQLLSGLDGSLYGITEYGGSKGFGTIFKIKADGTGYTKLFEFTGSATGSYPRGNLVRNATGTLFGTTNQGGINNSGVVFKINPDGSGFSKLHDFDDFVNTVALNGASPEAGLALGSDGDLYGTTSVGGTAPAFGVIFKVKQEGTNFTKLFDFSSASGRFVLGTMLQIGTSDLMVVTRNGGVNNKGVLFKIGMNGSGFAKLLDFDGINGSLPTDGLLKASNGFLYGTTWIGGANDAGVVYRVAADGTNFAKLLDFETLTKGSKPLRTTLAEGPDGFLYGTCSKGGINDLGTIYKIKLDGSGFQKLKDLDNSSGNNPIGGLIVMQVVPTISSFTPYGTVGATVVITGTNFDSTPTNNIVKFNGTSATVTASSSTSITTSVPPGATTGSISVTVGGQTVASVSNFTVKLNQAITFGYLKPKGLGDMPFLLKATASSGLPISYTSSNPAVASVSSNVVTVNGLGSTILKASQGGDPTFDPAPNAVQTLSVNQQWIEKNNGLYGGDIRSLYGDGTSVFASSSYGSIYRSTDNGSNWEMAATPQGIYNSYVLCVARIGTSLFAGTDGFGIYKSTDNGSNWTSLIPITVPLTVKGIANIGNNIFAATITGALLSTDDGANWTAINNGLTNSYMTSLAVLGTNLFAGTVAGVFMTADNGTTWIPVNAGMTAVPVQSLAVIGSNIFAGSYDFNSGGSGVYFSSDNGTSWTKVVNGLTSPMVSSLTSSGSNLFAGTLEGGVFKSSDNGLNWTATNNGITW